MKKILKKRLLSLLMVFAMLLSLVQGSGIAASVAVAAENPVNITLHFYNTYDWSTPALQFWGGSETVVSDNNEKLFLAAWGVDVYSLEEEGDNWYTITLKGDFNGFQFLNYDDPTGNTGGKGFVSTMNYCTLDEATQLYCKWGKETSYDTEWYLDKEYENSIDTLNPVDVPTETTITVHFKNTENWDEVAAYACEGGSWSQIKNYEEYGKSWPGKVVEADEKGWYTVSFTKNMDTLNIIFNNNGKGSQTDNLYITPAKAVEECWVVDDVVTDYCPTTYTLHYYNTEWSEVAAYLTETDLWTPIAGYTAASSWPGAVIKKDSANENWYTVTVKKSDSQLNVIFNNNNNGEQTGNINIVPENDFEELWVTGKGESTSTTSVAPENWVESDANDIFADDVVETYSRYALVEYIRPAGDYDNWNIYCWNSGYGKKTEQCFVEEVNGKHYIKFPVKDSTQDSKIEFCMRRSTDAEPWAEKDGLDHAFVFPAGQSVVHAVFEQGKGITRVYPANTGVERKGAEDAISFYYRDDALVLSNEEASLDGKVAVVVNGTEYPMSYNEENERYEATLSDCKSGDYAYCYMVDGERLLDDFNEDVTEIDGEKFSVVTFKNFESLSIVAKVYANEMDYNDNNVLSVELVGDDSAEISAEEISSVTANLSGLGLGEMAISPELMEGTFAVVNTVAAGEKSIPVVLKDVYGNVYETAAKVNVTARDNDGFDWDEAVIYFAVTDRFFDGNEANNAGVAENDVDKTGSLSYHGGDFAGLQAKLDYLQELGVNTVWITPIVAQSDITTTKDGEEIESTGYHGYWASNFERLNGHLGTEEEFASLINALHARGMKLMVDVVLNHAGYDTEDYFNTIIQDENGNYVAMVRDESNTIAGDTVYDSLANLPDFATENDDVRNQLIYWQTNWVDKYGIDYFRVDTVKHVDTTTWQEFKNELTKIDPDFKMIGEYSGGGYATLPAYQGAMDSLLDFDINDQAQSFVKGNVSGVESFFESRNAGINNTATMGAFLSSHDEDGLVQKLISQDGYSAEEALELFKVAAALQLTAKGQSVIYYGEEIGLYGADNYPYQTNRYDFDWDEAAKQAGEANSMLNHYKKLLSIRNDYMDVFAKGARSAVAVSDEAGYDVFARSYGDEKLYVGLNIKDEQQVTFAVTEEAGSHLRDLYSDNVYTVADDQTVTVTIPSAANGGTVILTEVYVHTHDAGRVELVKARANKDGYTRTVCTECGEELSRTVISGISSVALDVVVITENGKENKPVVVVKDAKGKKLKEGTDYTVKYSGNGKKPGVYTATVLFKGNYDGYALLPYTVVSKPVVTVVKTVVSIVKKIVGLFR